MITDLCDRVNVQHYRMYLQAEWKTVDLDQKFKWLRQKQADLDLQCFKKWINLGSAGQGLIKRLLDDNTKKMHLCCRYMMHSHFVTNVSRITLNKSR